MRSSSPAPTSARHSSSCEKNCLVSIRRHFDAKHFFPTHIASQHSLAENARSFICGKSCFLFRRSSQNKAGVFHFFSINIHNLGGREKEAHILCCPKIKFFWMTRWINYCIFCEVFFSFPFRWFRGWKKKIVLETWERKCI